MMDILVISVSYTHLDVYKRQLLIRFIALILALIVCGAVIVALVKMNPVDVYKACLLYTSH